MLGIEECNNALDCCNSISKRLKTIEVIEDFHSKGKEVPHIRMGSCARWSSFAQLFNKNITNNEVLKEFNLLKEDAEDIDDINDVTTYQSNSEQFISRDDTPLYKAYKVIEKRKQNFLKSLDLRQMKKHAPDMYKVIINIYYN